MEINQFQLTIPNLDSDNDTDMANTSINNQNNNINSDSQNINNFIQNNSDNLSLTDVPHNSTNSTTTELVLASSSLDTTTAVSINEPQFNPQNLIINRTQNLIINKNPLPSVPPISKIYTNNDNSVPDINFNLNNINSSTVNNISSVPITTDINDTLFDKPWKQYDFRTNNLSTLSPTDISHLYNTLQSRVQNTYFQSLIEPTLIKVFQVLPLPQARKLILFFVVLVKYIITSINANDNNLEKAKEFILKMDNEIQNYKLKENQNKNNAEKIKMAEKIINHFKIQINKLNIELEDQIKINKQYNIREQLSLKDIYDKKRLINELKEKVNILDNINYTK